MDGAFEKHGFLCKIMQKCHKDCVQEMSKKGKSEFFVSPNVEKRKPLIGDTLRVKCYYIGTDSEVLTQDIVY